MRILVVEDNPSHLNDAIEVLRNAGVEILFATDERHGLELLEDSSPDGVITDIFMPCMEGHPRYGSDNEPCGVAIALRAEKLGIPFVFCTAGHHHSARYQWVTDVAADRGWPMVDSAYAGTEPDSKEIPQKNWAEALTQVGWLIGNKQEAEVRPK